MWHKISNTSSESLSVWELMCTNVNHVWEYVNLTVCACANNEKRSYFFHFVFNLMCVWLSLHFIMREWIYLLTHARFPKEIKIKNIKKIFFFKITHFVNEQRENGASLPLSRCQTMWFWYETRNSILAESGCPLQTGHFDAKHLFTMNQSKLCLISVG